MELAAVSCRSDFSCGKNPKAAGYGPMEMEDVWVTVTEARKIENYRIHYDRTM
jgi:hypothetical protein